MEETLIQQVAKALHRAHYERGRRLYPQGAWEALDRFERESWLYSARASIEAMREPTEEMVEEAAYMDDHSGSSVGQSLATRVYRAMIDAALSEKPA